MKKVVYESSQTEEEKKGEIFDIQPQDDILKLVIETLINADLNGKAVSHRSSKQYLKKKSESVQNDLDHFDANSLAVHTLSAFFPNGHRSMEVEIFVNFQKEEATERLLDFVHALNVVARLKEEELVRSIEESQT